MRARPGCCRCMRPSGSTKSPWLNRWTAPWSGCSGCSRAAASICCAAAGALGNRDCTQGLSDGRVVGNPLDACWHSEYQLSFPFNFRVLSLCVRNHTCDTDLTFTSKPSPVAHWFAFPPPCRDIQLRMCAVPVQRPLLEGLLRHCLAERWLAAAEEQGENGWWVDVLGRDS